MPGFSQANSIARRAASLWDRVRGGIERDVSPRDPASDASHVTRRLERWRHVVAGGDQAAFERRLAWDDWTLADARAALEGSSVTSPAAWASVLEDVVASSRDFRADPPARAFLEPGRPRPFEDLLLPFVLVARRHLRDRLQTLEDDEARGMPEPALDDLARHDLERGLLDRLSRLSAFALHAEFTRFRPVGVSLLGTVLGTSRGDETRHYRAFTTQLLGDGWLPIFDRYPVLARHLCTAITQWVDACAEFEQRLRQDLPSLHRCFGAHDATAPGRATALRFGLSDFHGGGRCVIGVTFASGVKVAYKPKPLGADAAFHRFVDWCNKEGLTPALKTLRILERRGYGWMEWVDHRPCTNDRDVTAFFQRSGALLGLMYVLRGTDGHNENLVACGEHPVLIDLETLMEPRRAVGDGESPARRDEAVWQSVLRSGLLPRQETRPDSSVVYDVSALGGIDPQASPVAVPAWVHVNTDDMDVRFQPAMLPSLANVVVFAGAPESPAEHVGDIVQGFTSVYRLLSERRD